MFSPRDADPIAAPAKRLLLAALDDWTVLDIDGARNKSENSIADCFSGEARSDACKIPTDIARAAKMRLLFKRSVFLGCLIIQI
jgi:hypothetical protein